MYNNKSISVVISTFQEKSSIKKFIEDVESLNVVDEIVVVNNNAQRGTDDEVRQTNAKIIYEKNQGYGYGYRKGLRVAVGDLIIMTEADGTFDPNDFLKLLIYGDDFPVVFGTRTSSHAIGSGANMGLFLKWGNWFVAKLIEILFFTTQLSDVGCTTRLISKNSLKKISPRFTVNGNHFGLEMMLLVIKENIKFVEIPLKYNKRVGASSVTGNFFKTFMLGITMIAFSFKMRFMKFYRRES
jgi:glycosyltransferase involved in cell wall biosynthesis|tara:strand:- start:3670 stop:4392 length:723 start_codon:yes stop_codon:yes gene_type:complete